MKKNPRNGGEKAVENSHTDDRDIGRRDCRVEKVGQTCLKGTAAARIVRQKCPDFKFMPLTKSLGAGPSHHHRFNRKFNFFLTCSRFMTKSHIHET